MKSIFKPLVLTLACVQVACSDVGFTPGPQKASEDDGTGRGLSGTLYETFFANATNSGGKVDILFVIDNSTSMVVEQQRVAERMETFIQSLDGLDWQIGITTTDVSSGTFGLQGSLIPFEGGSDYVLSNKDPNYEMKFKNTIVRNETLDCDVICPSSNEQPLRAAMMAIDKRNGVNAGFFRSDASLAVIMMSDEDEMSSAPAIATTPQQFMNHTGAVFGTSKKVTVFGIVIMPNDSACYDSQDTTVYYGTYVAQLTEMTGGVLGSICDSDYARNLKNIGDRVQELADKVVLAKNPIPDSVSVTLTPALPIKWSLNGRQIVFAQTVPEGTRIDVAYKEQ